MKEKDKKQFKKLSKQLQKEIFQNKKEKGFNVDNIPLEFCLTSGELAESFDAWRKKKDDLGEELADTTIYLFGLASMLDIELGEEVVKKIKKNKKREYYSQKGALIKKKKS